MVPITYEAAFRGEDAIAEQVALRPELDGMATTLTAVLLQRDHRVVLLHAGDSRGYLFRDRRLYQLSKDDTFVQSLVDAGALSPDEARFHPQRNIVLRALSGRGTRFSLASWTVQPGDLLLLCSDGLSDALSDDQIVEVMSSSSSTDECAERLIGQALSSGARDNVTCIVAHVVEGPPEHRPCLRRRRPIWEPKLDRSLATPSRNVTGVTHPGSASCLGVALLFQGLGAQIDTLFADVDPGGPAMNRRFPVGLLLPAKRQTGSRAEQGGRPWMQGRPLAGHR